MIADGSSCGVIKGLAVFDDGEGKEAVQHVQPIVDLQDGVGAITQAIHELSPVGVAGVGAAVNDEAPFGVAVLVEVALDVIRVVAMRGVLRGSRRGRRGRREGLEAGGKAGMEGVVSHSEYY